MQGWAFSIVGGSLQGKAPGPRELEVFDSRVSRISRRAESLV